MSKRVAFLFSNLLVLTLLFNYFNLQAQTPTEAERDTSNYPYWIEMMQDPDANFHATVRAFNQYWEGREVTKGSGWKPFKRWESFMESRIKKDGSKPKPDEVWNEYWLSQKEKSLQKTSSTSNANWQEIGPTYLPANGTGQPNGVGRLNGIGFHPTDANTFYVGAPQGGVWKTTDNGLTWSSTTDALPTLGVSSILVDYNNPNIVYIGTGDRDAGDAPGLGVMKSTDAGLTWVSSNSGMGNKTVGMMVMHPTNPDIILAATSGGIYKTINGGTSWTQEQSGNFKDIEYKPSDPSIAYASSSGRFYRSVDGGDSWTLLGSSQGIPSAYRMVIGVTPDNPNVVYVLASNSGSFKAMYKSTNSGATFTTQSSYSSGSGVNIMDWSTDGSGTSGQAWYDLCIAVDPNDETIVYVGGINIFKSTNSGQNWTINAHWVGSGGADDIHADQHALEFSPVNDYLYSGNDGGVYFTNNGGTIWTDRSSGLGIAQVYKIGQSATEKDLVINGYQDNGTAVYDGNWRTEIGGDGMECIIDHSDSNYQYGALYYGDIRRSTNNGVSFSGIAGNGVNGINESGAWVTPYTLHETDANTMFIGMRNIWRSTNVKASSTSSIAWTKITNLSTSSTVRVVEHSPADGNLLYFVRSGTLYRIDNVMAASPTVIDLDANLPTSGTPTGIEAHPTNANIVYMTLSNNVYKSTNKGVSWIDISDNIPNINTNCIVYQIGTDDGLYVGTDAGVYYIDNTLTDWVEFDENLPVNSEVTELEIYYDANICNSRIRASTYGRGLWESTLQNADEFIIADFTAEREENCNDVIFTFVNESCNSTAFEWAFSPNSITYLDGTNSTSANPRIQLNAVADYTVTLTINGGADSKTTTISSSILPLTADFEDVGLCNTSSNCGTTICNLNLSENWFNETNGASDNIDWRADSGGTPSVDTGPSVDHTTGSATGVYLYLEASSGCTQQTAHLTSPCLTIPTGTTELRFWYHLYGFSVGAIHVDAFVNNTWNNDITTSVSGNQGDTWLEKVVDLSSYAGQTIKLRIRGITGPDWSSDVAIDDITIENTPPAITANFTASTTQGCEGTTINFTDTSTSDPTSWSWSFPGGTPSSSTLQNPTVTYNNAGIFTASLTASNGSSSNTLVKQSHITIFSPPTASISGDLQICEGESTTLTASGGNTYSWNTGANGNQITVSPTQNTSYTVTAIDANGCEDTHQVTVVVNPNPTASISGDLQICEGESTTLTASGGNTYLWNTGDDTAAITVSPTQNTIYNVTAMDGNCTGSNEVTVIVNANPTASISGNLDICEGESTTLTASGGNSYLWNTGDDTAAITVSPTQNASYTVTVIDANGCEDTQQVNVVVNANPTVSISGNLDICENESTTLTASGGEEYLWNTGDDTAAITVSPTQNTVYSVVVTDANGCHDTQEVTVNVGTGENCCETVVFIQYENTSALPPCVAAEEYIAAGNYGGGNTIISDAQTVQFTAGNYISLDPGFSVEQGGVFDTEITGIPSSPFAAAETSTLKTAFEESTLSNSETQLLIYPNPFTVATTANYYLYQEAEVSLSVYDLSGKKVEQLIRQQVQAAGNYKISFESCNLKQGIYICVLEIDGVQKVSKLLKQ